MIYISPWDNFFTKFLTLISLNNCLRYFLADCESPLPQLVFSIN